MLIDKSEANFSIANQCLSQTKEAFFSTGASRAYYAVFQASRVFLETKSFDYEAFLVDYNSRRPEKKDNKYSHGSMPFALKKQFETLKYDDEEIRNIVNNYQTLYRHRRIADYEDKNINHKDLTKLLDKADEIIELLKIKMSE